MIAGLKTRPTVQMQGEEDLLKSIESLNNSTLETTSILDKIHLIWTSRKEHVQEFIFSLLVLSQNDFLISQAWHLTNDFDELSIKFEMSDRDFDIDNALEALN